MNVRRDWRKRVGIEPTEAGFPRLPTDLKSAQDTSPEALPFCELAPLYPSRPLWQERIS